MPTIQKFNHQKIKSLEAEGNYTEYWEDEFPKGSFGIRVSGRTGSKKFILMYRNENGKRRRMTLGEFNPSKEHGLSLAEARGETRTWDDHNLDNANPQEATRDSD